MTIVTAEMKRWMRIRNHMRLAGIALLGTLVLILLWPGLQAIWSGLNSPNEIVQLRFMWLSLFLYVNGLAAVACWVYHFHIRKD